MSRLFDWVYQLTIIQQATGFVGTTAPWGQQVGNALVISNVNSTTGPASAGLRVQFEIKKNLGKTPNSCKIVVSNLSAHTRAQIERKPIGVQFAAGYRDSGPRLMFSGDLMRSFSELKDTDWETTLQVHDGGRAFAYSRVNKSYAPPVRVAQVVSDVAQSMGMTLPAEIQQSTDVQAALATGISLHSASRDALTRILSPLGYNWSVQNGRLQILKDGQLAAGQALLINQSTGLIGSPQRTVPDSPKGKSEFVFETLLYPEMLPAMQAQVQSKQYNGLYRIKELVHKGDTHGSDWKTTARCT